MAVRDGARGTTKRERARVPWPLWRRIRLPWLVAELVCVFLAAFGLTNTFAPDPWQPEGGLA